MGFGSDLGSVLALLGIVLLVFLLLDLLVAGGGVTGGMMGGAELHTPSASPVLARPAYCRLFR